MKWFKHMGNMRHDVKIRRLVNKYGIEGYGIYCAILEGISEKITKENPAPILEETSEDLAAFFKIDTLRVQEIVSFCVNQNLFNYTKEMKIICVKMFKFLDEFTRKSAQIQQIINSYCSESKLHSGVTPDKLRSESDFVAPELDKELELELELSCSAKAKPDNFNEKAKEIMKFLNEKTGRGYRCVKTNLNMIECRLKSGITQQQLKTIIARKCRDWKDDKEMRKYLRPSTLFRERNCEQYLGQITAKETNDE